jgi:serine/threonine-protein kinase
LRQKIRAAMPLDLHVRILADTLAGLHYAHTLTDFDGTPLHVVHRDVSPQNVFITYDGQVKLVDFGVAKAAGAANVTESGVFKGKIAYMAPEQASADPVDARADIFGVGVMLWEAIAGRRFTHGESQGAILARRMAGTEARVREVVPDADPEIADICDRAMAHDPRHRFATAQDMRDALEGFLHRFSRRVGAREVGKLVSDLFAEERERIRGIIDEQMKQLLRETAQNLPVPSLELWANAIDHTPTAVSGKNRQARASQSGLQGDDSAPGMGLGSHGTLVGANLSAAPPARRSRTTLIVGLAAVAISIIGVLLMMLFVGPSDGAPDAASAASADASGGTDSGETIQMEIAFGPDAATAKLDGVALAQSPFVAQMPRDGTAHTLEVSAPGYVTKTTMLSYDRDIDMSILLVEASASADASTSASAPTPGAGPNAKANSGQGNSGQGNKGTHPKTAVPPPKGGDGKQPLKIDEEDPYGK